MGYMGSAIPEALPKFPILISYHYLRKTKPEVIDKILNNKQVELLLDSGEFSAKNAGIDISINEYMDFLKTYKDRLFGYFLLDRMGDPEGTKKNLETMLTNGFKPIPIHVRGASESDMNDLFKVSDYIGLGGFRRPHRGAAGKDYVKQKMIWANGRNVHWLGYTNKDMITAFRPYSVDCSSWKATFIYKQISLYMGHGKFVKLSKKDFHEKTLPISIKNRLLKYGVEFSDLKKEDSWRGHGRLFSITSRSWIEFVLDIRQTIGTRLFLASCPQDVVTSNDPTAPDGIYGLLSEVQNRICPIRY